MNHVKDRTPATNHRRASRRRKYIINPAFQWKYAGTIMASMTLVAALLNLGLFAMLHQQARLLSTYPETYFPRTTVIIVLFTVAFVLLTGGALGAWWIVVTHRICGPLSVMGQWLSELGRGFFPKVRPLRRKDEFKDFYAIVSKTIDSLKTKREADLRAFQVALGEARSAADGDEETLRDALHQLVIRLESWSREAAGSLGVRLEEPLIDAPQALATAASP